MSSDPTDPNSSLLKWSSASLEVPAMVAGAGSRSSSSSSTRHRVSSKTRKDSQSKFLAIKDAHGRTWVSMNQVKRGSADVEMGPTPEGSPGPAGVAQSSTTLVLHLHDEKTQSDHLGVSPEEFGAVVAETQRLLDESRTRALHLEGFAQEIQDRGYEQIQQLKGMVESLYRACQSKD
jgi:hypothetical protein